MAMQRAARLLAGGPPDPRTVEGLQAELVRVVHESIKPDPLFKLALKTGAKGQVQWEIEYSGADPLAVEQVVREAHARLTETFAGAPAEFAAEP